MQEKAQIIGDFTKSIVAEAVILLIVIAVLILLFCVMRVKLKGKNDWLYKSRLILLFIVFLVCLKLGSLIPAFIDVYADTIEIVEMTEYECLYHNQPSFTLNPYGTTVSFTTADGNSLYGYLLEEGDIPDKGYGSILYAKHSRYILDYILSPND